MYKISFVNKSHQYCSHTKRFFYFSILLFFCFRVLCTAIAAPPSAEEDMMIGRKLSDFGDIEKTWHLVTVRYRTDSGELRVVYSNEIAWQTLSSGSTKFPDGAILAKIAMASTEDSLFTSSREPSKARRFQFMIRDQKQFAETRGWGYALFDGRGKVYPEDKHLQQVACNACHKLAAPRGDVFSRPGGISFNTRQWDFLQSDSAEPIFRIVERNELSPRVQKLLPKRYARLWNMEGELRKNLFQGTLDEIKPILSKKAAKTNVPAALISEDGSRFSIVIPRLDASDCKDSNEVALQAITSGISEKRGDRSANFCYSH